jgi:uncharacterized protein (TIGR02145 family)
MKTIQLFAILVLFNLTKINLNAQNVGINTIGAEPNSKALLDIDATGSNPKGGLLVPRMTTEERNAITAPIPESLIIYNTSSQCFEAWNATTNAWAAFGCLTGNNSSNGCTSAPSAVVLNNASNVSATSFETSWSSSVGANTYFIEISKLPNFDIILNSINTGGLTTFTVHGLEPNTTYYFRVKAVNNCGTSDHSNINNVTTTDPLPICGTQIWAASNLNVGLFISTIGTGPQQTNNGVIEKLCFNNVEANCDIYGGMYEWNELMNYTNSINCDPCGNNGRQGICPDGYHIPTDFEWSRYEYCVYRNIEPKQCPIASINQCLDKTLQAFQVGSTNLSAIRGQGSHFTYNANVHKFTVTNNNNPNWSNATNNNNSNFGSIPGGFRGNSIANDPTGTGMTFQGLGELVRYWTATEALSNNTAWNRQIGVIVQGQGSFGVFRHERHKNEAAYVRCIKN